MDDISVKEEPTPKVKVEIEPISVPIALPFFGKEEPTEEIAFTSGHTNEKRKSGRNSENASNKKLRLECNECHYFTPEKHNINLHMLAHAGKNSFQCEKCDFPASRNSKVKHHMIINTRENQKNVLRFIN